MKTIHFKPAGKRILFANFPADGHFNPLTGLAIHLMQMGYDVRWYTSKSYGPKLRKLHIPHYPFNKALDVNDGDFDSVFPARRKHTSQLGKLTFDLINAFILRAPEYYADIKEIHRVFPFDLMVADAAFTAIPFVKDAMNIPVVAVGVFPLAASSKDLPPAGLAMAPSYSIAGRVKQSLLRGFANKVLFKRPNRIMHRLLDDYGIRHQQQNVFDLLLQKSDLLLQSGAPGFEYKRSDLSEHTHFIGALLPYSDGERGEQWFDERLNRYRNIVLVTQGTVEKDVSKLLVPTLEAFRDTNTLVICTTGGAQTESLRARYPHTNIIIEDFIPFNDVMPYADVYITNGGYGGVMMSIENNVPLVVAGVHEGKNEICARVGYFKLGINLKTEKPLPRQLRGAAETVMNNTVYKKNVCMLADEFRQYAPAPLFANHIARLLRTQTIIKARISWQTEKIY